MSNKNSDLSQSLVTTKQINFSNYKVLESFILKIANPIRLTTKNTMDIELYNAVKSFSGICIHNNIQSKKLTAILSAESIIRNAVKQIVTLEMQARINEIKEKIKLNGQ